MTVRRLEGIGNEAPRTWILPAIFALEKIQGTRDWRQQIVEIVSDASGQLAERLQLLRFVKLRQGQRPGGRPTFCYTVTGCLAPRSGRPVSADIRFLARSRPYVFPFYHKDL